MLGKKEGGRGKTRETADSPGARGPPTLLGHIKVADLVPFYQKEQCSKKPKRPPGLGQRCRKSLRRVGHYRSHDGELVSLRLGRRDRS